MKKPPLNQIIKTAFLVLVVLCNTNVFPQSADNIFVVKEISPDFKVYVDGLPDSAARHTTIDRISLTAEEEGWYRVFFHLAYSGDSQPNEHVFVTVSNGDSVITPLDKNLGPIRVLRDTSAVPDTLWRNTGIFYLLPGENQILMHHYNAVFKDESFRELVASVPESELKAIVFGDSIGDRQSVHIDSMIIYGHPNFRALTDLTKKDSLIDVDGSKTLSVGDIIEYTIEISNSGNGIAHDVFISDTIPSNTAYVSGSGTASKGTIQSTEPVFEVEVGNIAPSKQEKISISYQVRVTTPTDSVKNQGFLSSEENDSIPTDDPDTDQEDDPTITVVPDFSGATDLLKTDFFVDANNNVKIDAGDTIRYTVTIQNSGLGTAHNVVFTDSIPNFTQYISGSAVTSRGTISSTSPILQVNIGTVAPNKSEKVTISFSALVTQSVTMISNQGYLNSNETDPIPTDDPDTNEEDDPTKTVIPSFDGKTDLLKTDFFVDTNNNGKIDRGDSIRYTITIKNSGLAAANNVVFTDSIPNFTQYVSGSAATSKGTILSTSPIFQVNVGSVAPNQTETVTISFSVLVTQSITMISNQGYLDSDEIDHIPTDDPETEETDDPTKTIVPSFDGKTDLTKDDFFVDTNGNGKIDSGDSIRYTITIKNSGLGTAHNVVFSDSIPNFTQYVAGSAATSKGNVVSTSPVLQVNVGSVAPNQSETVTISFTVLVTQSITMVSNQGYLDSDETKPIPTDDPKSDDEDDPTKTVVPSFEGKTDLLKTDFFVDVNTNGKIDTGDSIRYTIQIKNSGQGAAHNVVFADSIPSYTQYVSGSANTSKGTITATSPVLRAEIGSIAPNESETVTISFSVLVTESITMVENQGYLDSDEINPTPTDDPETDDEDDPTKTVVPSFEGKTDVLKSDFFVDVNGNGKIDAGDSIRYTIQIKNSGQGAAHNVTFSDSIPSYTQYAAGTVKTSKGKIVSISPVLKVEIGSIAPNESETVTISFAVLVSETITLVENQGYLDSDETNPVPTDDPESDDEDDPTKTIVPSFDGKTDLTKDNFFVDTNGNGKIDSGDSIRYTILIKNSGLGVAHNVVFSDSIPSFTQYVAGSAATSKGTVVSTSPVLQVNVGSVAPNQSETVTIFFTVLVTQSITMVSNQGYLDSDETKPIPTDDPKSDDEDDPTKTVVPSFEGKTDLLKTDFFVDANSNGKIDTGDSIRYTIQIKNSGQGTAHNVVFSDSIPNYTQYAAGTVKTSKGTIVSISPVLKVEIGSIAPNEAETVTISFSVVVTESVTMVENQGYLDSDETVPTPTDDPDSEKEDDSTRTKTASFSGINDVLKTDTFIDANADGSISAGDTIKYRIDIKNSGGATAYQVVFQDTIPENTSLIENSITATLGKVTATSPIKVEIDSIAGSSSQTVTIRFSVLVTKSMTELKNQGYVSANDTPTEPTDDPETEISNDPTITTAPSFYGKTDLIKSAIISDVDDNKLLSADDIITYSIRIRNSGKGVAKHVVFQDTIPEYTAYVSGSAQTSKGTILSTSPILIIDIGDIAPESKETVTISFQVRITETVEQVSNQGFIHSDETGPIPTDDPNTDDEDDRTKIDNSKFFTDIELKQFVSTDSFFVQNGDTINFANEGESYPVTIRLKNIGGDDAGEISLVATFPGSLTISSIQPIEFLKAKDSIIWKFKGLASDSSLQIKYNAQLPAIMGEGENQLLHSARVTCVNENPGSLSNNTDIDTVYSFGKVVPVPEIQATPSILDVNDSVTVSVKIPKDKVSWDLWIYLPDSQIVKNFADDFIATNNIERDAWVEIPIKYSETHLLTTQKQEQVVFEVLATEIRGIEKTAQSSVTFRSSNYLVLDKNVFRPDVDGTLGIKFKLSYRRLATLDIYDLAGTHITRVAEDVFDGGWNTYYWDGTTESGIKAGSGVYIVTLRTDEFKGWKKVIIIR